MFYPNFLSNKIAYCFQSHEKKSVIYYKITSIMERNHLLERLLCYWLGLEAFSWVTITFICNKGHICKHIYICIKPRSWKKNVTHNLNSTQWTLCFEAYMRLEMTEIYSEYRSLGNSWNWKDSTLVTITFICWKLLLYLFYVKNSYHGKLA